MSYVHTIAKQKNLPIVDATQPALIGVSVDDIKKAKAKNSKCCAFARATQKEPGVVAAYFFRSTAFIEYADRIVRYVLPTSAQREIVSFDRAGLMAPGEYKLNPVPKSQGLAAMRRYNKKATKAKRKAAAKAASRTTRLIEHVGVVRADLGAPAIPELQSKRTRTAPKYVRDLTEPTW